MTEPLLVPQVVFCTYQSSTLIEQAHQDMAVEPFDLAVADEAHRCTGKVGTDFTTVLDNSKIRSLKRLFTTATPRTYSSVIKKGAEELGVEVVGMDDEEVFGPVVVAIAFDEPEEVVTMANDTEYGLAASVWTESLSAAHRLAADIRAGTVWINSHSMYDASLPIGGVKQSGWGRDSGHQAVENYLETKTVCAVI